MLQAVHIFGTSSSGIGALGVNGQAFIIQLITFVLVILVLKKWAVKPILKLLNERREVIEKGVELGQKMQQEKDELEEKIANALRDARVQADTIIASARDEGRQVVQEAEEAARTKAEALVNAAADRIKQDTDRAWKNVEKELASLVSEATEAIIDEKVDAKKDAELIDKALKSRRTA
jgi:F-type H+-transporting ATPase subunit b